MYCQVTQVKFEYKKVVHITCAGNVDKQVNAVYRARRDRKLDPFKVFNDYSKEAELSAKQLAHVRSYDGKMLEDEFTIQPENETTLQPEDEATLHPLLPSPSRPSCPSHELLKMSQNELETFIYIFS